MILTNASARAMVKLLLLALPCSGVTAMSGMALAAGESRAKYTALVNGAQPQNGVSMWVPSTPGTMAMYPMPVPMALPMPVQPTEQLDMGKLSLKRSKLRELSKQMSSSAMKLNLAATERIRHIAARMYRQIKFKTLTPFYKKVALKVQEINSHQTSVKAVTRNKRRTSSISPDVVSCYALISCARDFLDTNDRHLVDEYLEFIQPGTPEADHELLGCWSETVPASGFQRFFFKISDEAVENIIVRALERAGNIEVTGTRSAGHSEALAQQYLDQMENNGASDGGRDSEFEPWE